MSATAETTAALDPLTPARQQTLQAVVERILPGIHGPGAAGTHAAAAVAEAMRHRFLRGLRGGLEQLLDRLDTQARQRFTRDFADCAPAERDDLLRELAHEPHPWMRMLWRALITLSLEGHLGDPRHGGNVAGRGWDAVGLRAADVQSGFCRGARQR